MMNTKFYLYDADGSDREIYLDEIGEKSIGERQILWINILGRDESEIRSIIEKLPIENVPIQSLLETKERPKLEKFEKFYRFFIIGVNKDFQKIPIDFLVGENFVVTVQNEKKDFFKEFRDRKEGESQLGNLDTESFVSALLDLQIVGYFRAVEIFEKQIDELDEKILRKEVDYEQFLKQIVSLRSKVSKLRRWLLPHRDVFYPLTRPDFFPLGNKDTIDQLKSITTHFENAVDSIESSRETLLGLFDLYATKSNKNMNDLIQRLTFITVLLGSMGVIAGILGMNFKEDFFESPTGFWWAVGLMFFFSSSLMIIARWRKWI
ncbi:MAG: hypothetical protein K1X72_26710 [Pyrinomonadaceae bacterium]|nr:hypothetical protein [Pyrinomonadaceae bacterium]